MSLKPVVNLTERLNLPSNGIGGTIPSGVGELLSLRKYGIAGSPLCHHTIIHCFNHTEQIDLSNNELVGPLPSEIGYLTDLRKFQRRCS